MFITTRITFDMLSGAVLEHEGFYWAGGVELCKGDDVAKQQEQQQLQFNQQMQSIFSQQFQKQSATLAYLQSKLQPMIDKPTGYSPDELAAMRTGATDQLSTSYQNATKALQNTEAVRSGDLPSGVNEQLNSGLLQQEASDKANAQNNITVNDANLKQSNYWGAINALNGNAVEQNPLGYAGTYNQGSGNISSLSQAVTASNQSQLLGALGGVAAGVGSAAGGFLSKGCYVAAAVFNEDFNTGYKTARVRDWLWNTWSKHWYAKPILGLYAKYGLSISRKPFLVKTLSPLFRLAYRKATEFQCQYTH